LVAQLLGLGKAGQAYKDYRKNVQATKNEVAAFRKEASAKELSAAGQRGGAFSRAAGKVLGPTKQFEAAASEFKLKKLVAGMDKLITRERFIQHTLQAKANVLQEENVFLKDREGAIDRANNNISKTGEKIAETKVKLLKAQQATAEAIADIKPSTLALDNLKAENKLIKENIKDRQTELANIIGSRGAGRGTGGKRGQQNLAKEGLILERDRVKIATEVLRLEDKIAILKGKHGLQGVLSETQRARVLQQLDRHTGERNRKRAALREDAGRKEVKAARAVAREQLNSTKNTQKQLALSNRIAQQQRGVAEARQQEVALNQQIASLQEFIANTEGTIKILNFEIEASKLRQKEASSGLTKLEEQQLKLLDAKVALEKAITKQKEKSEAADKRAAGGLLSRGGRGIGGAIGLSIGFNLAAEGIRELKEEGDKTTEAIAVGFERAGGIAVTAMLLPLGPLSAVIIAMQTIIGLVKIASLFTTSWKKESSEINERLDKLTNTLRLTKSVFKDLADISSKIQLEGLSVVTLGLLNEKMEQLRKGVDGIDSSVFDKLAGDIRKAAKSNNIEELERLLKRVDELSGQQLLSENLVSPDLLKQIKKVNDEALRTRQLIETPSGRAQIEEEHRAEGFVPGLGPDAVEVLRKTEEALKDMRAQGKETTDNLVAGFLKASDASKSYAQEVERFKLKETFDITGVGPVAEEKFLRQRKGFDILTDGSRALKEAQRESADVFQKLLGVMDESVPTVQATREALDALAETSGKNVTAFFNVRDAMKPFAKEFKDLAILLTFENLGSTEAQDIIDTMDVLTQAFIDGKAPIRGLIDENGNLAFKIQGLNGVIGKNHKAYALVNDLIDRFGTTVGIAENDLDSFGATQLSHARVTELLAQKYLALADSVRRTTQVLSSTAASMTEVTSLNSKLAASFPEKALEVNLELMTALKDRAATLGEGLDFSINALEGLDEALNITRGTLGTRITDAFAAGGDASIDWAHRLEVAAEVVDDMSVRLNRLEGQVKSTDFGGDQFKPFKAEVLSLTKELVQIEKLSGAVLGLAALREKLLETDGQLLEDDTALLKKFEGILAQGFDFSKIDLSLGSNKELAGEITRVLDSLSSTFRKKGAGTMGRAAQKLSVVIIEKMNTTLSTGGDTLSQRLDTILTQAAAKISDKLQEPIQELRENLGGLREESVATLSAIVASAETNLKTLGDIISKGIIPPDKTLTDILVGQFVVAEEASQIALGKIQKRLGQLKVDNLRLVKLQEAAEKTNKNDLARGEKIRKARKAVDASNAKIFEFTLKETAELKKQEGLRSELNQVLLKAIQTFGASMKGVFAAQNAVITTEEKLFKTRLGFIAQEDATIGKRLSILQLERDTFESIRRSVTGVERADLATIGDEIARLTKEAVAKSFTDAASAEFIRTRIAKLQEQFNVEKQIATLRVKSLQSELDLLNKQEKQIKDLGLAFLKATTEQQKGIIGAARLTEKFFGGIGSGKAGPNTQQVKSSILNFLKNSDDKTRQSVIGQLERLKAAGGEVAPGVPAAKILSEMGKFIGDALFKNPQIAIAERQEKIQDQIRIGQEGLSEIARVQLRISEATLRAQHDLATAVATRVVSAGAAEPGAIVQATLTKGGVQDISSSVKTLIATQKERAKKLKEEQSITDSAAVTNKKFVDVTKNVDVAIGEAGLTMEEFQTQAAELRTALVEADDAFIEAQQGVTDASNGVLVAFANAAKAQADYTIAVAEATRQNTLAVGGFQTYREELDFVTVTYQQQITALRQVGSTEQQIAALRVDLAKQQLSIFESQIANVRSNARALLTQEGAGLDFFQAGQAAAIAADLAAQAGITAGGGATSAQQDAFAKSILALPLEVRQSLDKAFAAAPPGQTAGAFGIQELEAITLSALGGRSDVTPDLLSLEKQAAQQRTIIAENSTSQLESTRAASIAALEQLATAREGLMEAKANKDLARMQLDSLQSELPQQTHLLSEILKSTNVVASATNSLNSGVRAGTALEFMTGQAAKGTLSGSEVAGLLNAASREKGAMPAGSNLGVFNTSETVLTRAQMGRLRSGVRTPNAVNGTGLIGTNEVVSLLTEIANRVAELRQGGITQKIDVTVENNRRVNIEGLAGLQTALQDIIGDRTNDLYTREEAEALEQVLQTILNRLRETGQVSAIGT
jgi:hypothetical protein